MGKMIVDNKSLMDNYQPTPTMHYDIEGKVLKNDGKNITIGKTSNDIMVEYSIRLKEEMDVKVGDRVKVEKENIHSVKTDVKEDEELTDEEVRDIAKVLRDLGLEYSSENVRMIDNLVRLGIKPVKQNVDSYKASKENLDRIAENIDTDSIIKLMDRGMDFENENLLDVAEAIESVKDEKTSFSVKRFLKLEEDLTYKEAEIISKEIYGQKMGKDVYDVIIALDREGKEITKGNIDETLEILSKVHDIKGLEDESYVKIINEELDFSINNLYKIKNNYTTTSFRTNKTAGEFEGFTIFEEVSLDSLKELLMNLDIEVDEESISIAREFTLVDMILKREDYEEVVDMKEAVEELKDILNDGEIVRLIDREVDVLNEDVRDLVDVLVDKEMDREVNPILETEIDVEDLELLDKIEDRDLLSFIRDGKDFNLKNLKEIIDTDLTNDLSLDFKTVDMTKSISTIFSRLGQDLNRDRISLTLENKAEVSLKNLYESDIKIENENLDIESVDIEEEDILMKEYIKVRNDITTNVVRESIKEGKNIETMPLPELNKYLDKKIDRYREVNRWQDNIKSISDNKDKLIPMIMKNDLAMTLKEIKDLNDYFLGETGINRSIEKAIEEGNKEYKGQYKEDIDNLKKDISDTIKKGEKLTKEDYTELMNVLSQDETDLQDGDKSKKENEFLEMQKKISKKDLIFQVPVNIGDKYKDLNIIIPDMNKSMDKNHMRFAISLGTTNLGEIDMDMNIVGRDIFLDITEEENKLGGKIDILKDYLKDIGYNLNFGEMNEYEE